MAVYKVGTLQHTDTALTNFLFQTTSIKVVAKKFVWPDESGNRVAVQHFDHVLQVQVKALIPRGVALPVPGQQITLDGLVEPVIAADGSVTSGTLQVADPEGSGSGAPAGMEFVVTGEPQIVMENEKGTEMTFDAERGIINGVPAAASSGA